MKTKRLVFLFGLCAFGLVETFGVEVNWRHDPGGALEEGKESGKPVMLFFTAPWCGYCRMMDNLTFQDPGVAEALEDFVTVKVDHDTYPRWVARYRVRGIPATIVLNDSGRPAARADGFFDAERFTRWLRELDGEGGGDPVVDPLEVMAGVLRDGFNDEDPKARAAAVTFALEQYTGDDPAAAALAERSLAEAQRERPEEFFSLLEDERLAVRILAANLFREQFGDGFEFDPWADEAERSAYVREYLAERD